MLRHLVVYFPRVCLKVRVKQVAVIPSNPFSSSSSWEADPGKWPCDRGRKTCLAGALAHEGASLPSEEPLLLSVLVQAQQAVRVKTDGHLCAPPHLRPAPSPSWEPTSHVKAKSNPLLTSAVQTTASNGITDTVVVWTLL